MPKAQEQNASPQGFPVLQRVPGHVITDELVARYRDDDDAGHGLRPAASGPAHAEGIGTTHDPRPSAEA